MVDEGFNDFLDLVVSNVKNHRKERDISQLKLAHILNQKSPNYIAKIETRKHNVTYNLRHLYIIAIEFEIDIFDLIPRIEKGLDKI